MLVPISGRTVCSDATQANYINACVYIYFSFQIKKVQFLDSFEIGNHMISSAIWDKSARVNFSKANQIARARRASAICSL